MYFLLLAFARHPSFLQGTNCLRTLPLLYWLVFYISFISVSISFCCSRPVTKWKGIFDLKGFLWKGITQPSTKFRILWSLVIFFQAFEKCFSLPAIGTSGSLFEDNNLFINGWTFSYSNFKLISGTKSMLKKVLLEECIFTISLLTCLCFLTKLAATIIEFSVIRLSAFG